MPNGHTGMSESPSSLQDQSKVAVAEGSPAADAARPSYYPQPIKLPVIHEIITASTALAGYVTGREGHVEQTVES